MKENYRMSLNILIALSVLILIAILYLIYRDISFQKQRMREFNSRPFNRQEFYGKEERKYLMNKGMRNNAKKEYSCPFMNGEQVSPVPQQN